MGADIVNLDGNNNNNNNYIAPTFGMSGNRIIDSLIWDEYVNQIFKWDSSTLGENVRVSYSFNTDEIPLAKRSNLTLTNVYEFSEEAKEVFREALLDFEKNSGLCFYEVKDSINSDVRIYGVEDDGWDLTHPEYGAFAAYPKDGVTGSGDAFFSGIEEKSTNLAKQEKWQIKLNITHELGHAVGLQHPFAGEITFNTTEEHNKSRMTYTEYATEIYDHLGEYDILALQYLYGTSKGTFGTVNNDIIEGNSSTSFVNGDVGTDTLTLSGNKNQYDLIKYQNSFNIKSSTTDILADGVERISFDDISLALDIEGITGQAYRIYQAAFDRTPDLEGLGYWISEMDKGMSVEGVSNSFIYSQEFQGLYGTNPTNEAFVTLLYNNVLNRDPDTGGMGYWLNELYVGNLNKAGVLASFSESTENINNVADIIANGIEYVPYDIFLG